MESPIQKTYSHGSLFAGIGGLCTSFNNAGFESLFVNEIDKKVSETYLHNYPSKNLLIKPIQEILATDLEPVDVLHGGFPCQSFSIAGARKGFDDPRGKMFFEVTRLIKEFKQHRPKVLVLENSPYLRIGADGSWFRRIKHELAKLGYWFDDSNAIQLNVATHTGVPQSRERLFMIALDSECFDYNPVSQADFEKVALKPMSEFLDVDKEVDPSYYLDPENKYSRLIMSHKVKSNAYKIYQLRKFEVRLASEEICPTLTANMGTGGHNVPFIINKTGVRKLTERECLNLQGFDESFVFPDSISKGARYSMIGNAVSPLISNLLVRRVNQLLRI